MKVIAGVDEVGRGSLFGNVVAAAVVLPKGAVITNLNDSKKLSPNQRTLAAKVIKEQSSDYSIAQASAEEIDQFNIHQASLLAMKRAVEGLQMKIDEVWVDGKYCPNVNFFVKAFIRGDALHSCISAASILAKVARDQQLLEMDKYYPEYGFAQHKGYPTLKHIQAIKSYGLIKGYRTSYKPVAEVISKKYNCFD